MFHDPQVVLFSDDLRRAIAFYEQLGFTEVFRVPQDGDPIHVDLELDGTRIGFASARSTRDDHGLSPAADGHRAAVVVWTDDVEAAYQHLTEVVGVTGLRPPHPWLEHLRIAWVEDPDGTPVQLVQRR